MVSAGQQLKALNHDQNFLSWTILSRVTIALFVTADRHGGLTLGKRVLTGGTASIIIKE